MEAIVRGLCALGVLAESYGSLLTSVLVNKLPSELHLIVSYETTTEKWESTLSIDGVLWSRKWRLGRPISQFNSGTPLKTSF